MIYSASDDCLKEKEGGKEPEEREKEREKRDEKSDNPRVDRGIINRGCCFRRQPSASDGSALSGSSVPLCSSLFLRDGQFRKLALQRLSNTDIALLMTV